MANLKKADNTAVDTITYAGETYSLTEGKFSVDNVYYAVESDTTVIVGGENPTVDTSNATAFEVCNGAKIQVSGATDVHDSAGEVLQAVSGTGEVILRTDAQILPTQMLAFSGDLTVDSGATLTLGPSGDSRNTMSLLSRK